MSIVETSKITSENGCDKCRYNTSYEELYDSLSKNCKNTHLFSSNKFAFTALFANLMRDGGGARGARGEKMY